VTEGTERKRSNRAGGGGLGTRGVHSLEGGLMSAGTIPGWCEPTNATLSFNRREKNFERPEVRNRDQKKKNERGGEVK